MTIDEKTNYVNKISEFKKLSKAKKYNVLSQFCKKHKRYPTAYKSNELEKTYANFFTNNKNAYFKGKLENWEDVLMEEILSHEPKRESRELKLKRILRFCQKHKTTPSQASKKDNVKKLGQLFNSVKNSIKKDPFTEKEQTLYDEIMTYRSKYQRSREEKLQDVLDFCIENDRTPKQHVDDINEKRLAEFLSTNRILHNKGQLNSTCTSLLNEIIKFAPTTSRIDKIKELDTYTKTHKTQPKSTSLDSEEKRLASTFTKMKSLLRDGKLKPNEIELFNRVLKRCNVKSRKEKLLDLKMYILENGRHPRIKSTDDNERKMATFFNNIRQANKNGKLKRDEISVLKDIEKARSKTTSAFS